MMSLKLIKGEIDNFRSIYEDMKTQFPPEELKSFEKYTKLLQNSVYELYLAYDNEKNVGYAVIVKNEKHKTVWLDYLAVYKQFHSNGYGAKILKAMQDCFKTFLGCYLEVEKPNEDIPDTIRRIKFYKNLGAFKLNCDYYYPNADGDLAMDLYFIQYQDKIPDCSMTQDVIDSLFKFLHSDIEHVNNVLKKITFID